MGFIKYGVNDQISYDELHQSKLIFDQSRKIMGQS